MVDHALVSKVEVSGDTSTGAVYNQHGAIVLDSLRPSLFTTLRPTDPVSIDRHAPAFANVPSIPEAIFGGHFFFAWGHFLVETLTAATGGERLPRVPVVYIPFEINYENQWTARYRRHTANLLDVAWDGRPVAVVYQAQHVVRLHIPQRTTAIGTTLRAPTVHPASAQVYDRLREHFGAPRLAGRIVLVTRSVQHRRFHPHERAVYEFLQAVGVHSFEPGAVSPEAQIREIAQADVLIGFSGSHLHNSVFMYPGSHVIEIGDERLAEPNRLQLDLARNAHHPFHYIPGYEEGEPRSLGSLRDDLNQSLRVLPDLPDRRTLGI